MADNIFAPQDKETQTVEAPAMVELPEDKDENTNSDSTPNVSGGKADSMFAGEGNDPSKDLELKESPELKANPDRPAKLNEEGVQGAQEQKSQFDPSVWGPIETGEEDQGNNEHLKNVDPPSVNDDGNLVAHDGSPVFSTVEQSLKDGSMLLDSQGRMPGVYLQDLEAEARARHGDRVAAAFEDAKNSDNGAVSREVNVTSSPLPPVTVPAKQEGYVNPAPAALDNTVNRPVSEEEVTRNN